MHRKILFAVGGTGGHLFPAQVLARELKARELKENNRDVEILFAGSRLGSNPFFHKLKFPFCEVTSGTPFRGNLFRSLFQIAKGLIQSFKLNREFSPDLIVGFGSFYSFPLLLAAKLQGIPYILVESNAYPGRVNRLFSAGACFSALQFQVAEKRLRGKSTVVKIPHWSQRFASPLLTAEEARKSFGLAPNCLTLLIMGGSQGARSINEMMLKVELSTPFQVIHLCGLDQDDHFLSKRWREKGITAYVRPFEEKMYLVWRAADLAVCRAGGRTCSEMIESTTPALFIPWSGASERHQWENARVLCDFGAALTLEEGSLDEFTLTLEDLVRRRSELELRLKEIKRQKTEELGTLIMRQLK